MISDIINSLIQKIKLGDRDALSDVYFLVNKYTSDKSFEKDLFRSEDLFNHNLNETSLMLC